MLTRTSSPPNIANLSQKHIRKQIHAYLTAQKRDPAVIAWFTKGKGFCHGLAILAAYAQYLESQTAEAASLPPRDDWAWFENTMTTLAGWDGNLASLSDEARFEIERLISLMEYFQHINRYSRYTQGRLHRFLEDTSMRKIQLEYTLGGLFTAEDFTKKINLHMRRHLIETTLMDTLTRHEQRLILISCGNHSLSLFRNGGHICLYNSNNPSGLVRYEITDKNNLVKGIFQAYKYDPSQPSPLGFRIFTFDKQVDAYPDQHNLLEQMRHPLVTASAKRKVDYSALHIAARIGSTSCVAYFLRQGAEVDGMHVKQRTALYIAAGRGYQRLTKLLLKNNADINKICINGKTPLIRAARSGHVRIVKTMLTHDKNATLDNLITALSHLGSRSRRRFLLKILNTGILKKMTAQKELAEAELNLYKLSSHYKESVHQMLSHLITSQPARAAETTVSDHLRFFRSIPPSPSPHAISRVNASCEPAGHHAVINSLSPGS
ncbi:hypothetical protein AQUSIP_17740 [Aquicella siphonis]|uniref:Uncharacterized protein n=1 Tax=Aquicella siphonis TaxID=254247 RepID=A0A5E4PJD7_9COXI|nr:ankyrin repeat domain-containing protein [Aquicella siphonis]VVC76461.1 hypothetical protein AQUSIP_17740 [Aquicella siphonis]